MEEKKMTILIKNGRVINPATGTDETLDVLAVSYTHLTLPTNSRVYI